MMDSSQQHRCPAIRILNFFLFLSMQVGSRGNDEWGLLWESSMQKAHVGTSRMKVKHGSTGRECNLL